MQILAIVVFTIIFIVSLIGIVVPVVPGVPLAAVGALLAGWMTGFEELTMVPLLIVAGLAVLSQVVELLSSWVGAKYYGAGRPGLWGGVIGSLLGLVLFPPFGFLFGALVGAVLFEMLAGREFSEAWRAGVGAFLGTLGGAVAKVFILIAIGLVVYPRLI